MHAPGVPHETFACGAGAREEPGAGGDAVAAESGVPVTFIKVFDAAAAIAATMPVLSFRCDLWLGLCVRGYGKGGHCGHCK